MTDGGQKMSFRPLPIMTLCVVASLLVLGLLGKWQWQRYGEKQGAAETVIAWEALSGPIVHADEFLVSTIINGRSAWKHIALVEEGAAGRLILATVFVSFQINAPERSEPPSDGYVSFTEGTYVVPSGAGRLTPAPDGYVFYAADLKQMGALLDGELAARLHPRIYEPRALSVRDDAGDYGEIDNPFADPVLADPLPPARHLGYALTWWGMALALCVIYLVYHAGVGRLSFGKRQ